MLADRFVYRADSIARCLSFKTRRGRASLSLSSPLRRLVSLFLPAPGLFPFRNRVAEELSTAGGHDARAESSRAERCGPINS